MARRHRIGTAAILSVWVFALGGCRGEDDALVSGAGGSDRGMAGDVVFQPSPTDAGGDRGSAELPDLAPAADVRVPPSDVRDAGVADPGVAPPLDVPEVDAGLEVDALDATGTDAGACPVKGAPGCPCTTGEDCAPGGYCIEGGPSPVCTVPCAEGCPDGWACGPLDPEAADPVAVCRPQHLMLCAPCTADGDCLDPEARCLDHGVEGRFCGSGCGGDGDCPPGYGCVEIVGGQAPLLQCLPLDGACSECTARAVRVNASTTCSQVFEGKICTGERSCGPQGLGACHAAPPAEEICNGQDDDCDDQTDEGFALGETCSPGEGPCAEVGTLRCAPDGAGVVCGDTQPPAGSEEICNGQDDDCNDQVDEGFALGETCSSGKGICARNGKTVCAPDGKGVVCDAVEGPGKDEACNGQDDNCNDQTDEGCDDDGDGWCDEDMAYGGSPECPKGGGDCDDTKTGVNPAGDEVCDGLDNDCDDQTDGMSQGCSNACGAGTETCTLGQWGGCTAPAPQCTSGPCCDGCSFRPPSFRCGTSPDETRRTCEGSCGGKVRKQERWRYCTGSAGGCGTGNRKWEDKGVVSSCGAGDLCSQSGPSASCTSCPFGCAGGKCKSQPAYTICVDPGYGGSEPGPVHNGLQGKAVTLSVATHLKTWLEKDSASAPGGGTWKVVLTRTGDQSLTNAQRAAKCNAAGAHRLVAIRVNACCGNSATGIETYRKSSAGGTAKTLANLVQAEVVEHLGLKDRGVKTASWTILTQTNAPACSTFLGFLDNSGDAAKLGSNSVRKEVAKGLLHAVQRSFGYSAFTP